MPDFRTKPPGGQSQGSDEDFMAKAIRQAREQLDGKPQEQAQIAKAINENYGLPMEFLTPIFPQLGEGLELMERAEQEQAAETETVESPDPPMPESDASAKTPTEAEPKTAKPTPDELIGFVDEIIEYTDEDMTLGDLREWAEENKDMLKTAIQLKF